MWIDVSLKFEYCLYSNNDNNNNKQTLNISGIGFCFTRRIVVPTGAQNLYTRMKLLSQEDELDGVQNCISQCDGIAPECKASKMGKGHCCDKSCGCLSNNCS